MSKYITATEARKRFYAVIEEADHPGMSVVVTHEGLPKVVLMSFDEFEGWQETMEVMSDPSLVADIKESLRQLKKGDTITLEELKKKLKL